MATLCCDSITKCWCCYSETLTKKTSNTIKKIFLVVTYIKMIIARYSYCILIIDKVSLGSVGGLLFREISYKDTCALTKQRKHMKMRIEDLRRPFSTKLQLFPAGVGWWISHAIICYLVLTDRSGSRTAGEGRGGGGGQWCPSWPGHTPPPSEQNTVDLALLSDIRPTTVRQGLVGGGKGLQTLLVLAE